ncbi:hypothetical protein [Comamonas sp. HJ-2]
MDLKNSLIGRLGFSVFALGLGALGVFLIGLTLLGLGDGLALLVGSQTAAHILNAATVAYPVFVVVLALMRMADVSQAGRATYAAGLMMGLALMLGTPSVLTEPPKIDLANPTVADVMQAATGAIGLLIYGAVILWAHFAAMMFIDRRRVLGNVSWWAWVFYAPVWVVGIVINVLFNHTAGSLIFRSLPKWGKFTFSARITDLVATDSGQRGDMALKLRQKLLDYVDWRGAHVQNI